ncbi:hypothetical protein EUTSA_v10005401mg [Eutrema salsugineum]|uniref:Knottin scorpion toxin-like domain-containing protein n=1 Tax=Eutrema salsugineum TaxID=72664 RepID=V4MLS8_EUTSA|nr:hypothetical protein EUTSA_v10005401mg [Eutrema salsugineum]
MSKQLVSYLMVLMVLFSVLLVIPKTEAQKRCREELEPETQCVWSTCKQECFIKWSGYGACIQKPGGSRNYVCNCFYNCGAP